MLNETRARQLLHQAGESIPVGHQSSEELLAGSRHARRKRAVAQVVMAAAAVVLVLSGAVVIPKVWDAGGTPDSAPSGDRRSQEVTTPRVEGLFASQAYRTLRDSGFDVKWINCASNASCPQGEWGQVLDQEPKAGTLLEVGSTVTLMVLGYGRDNSVFSPDAALTADGELALTLYGSSSCPERPKTVEATGGNEVTVTTSIESTTIPRRVCTLDSRPLTSIVQLPAAIDGDSPVVVTVVMSGYSAPTRIVARPTKKIRVPAVVGLPEAEARQTLEAFELRVLVSNTRAQGEKPGVASQDPAAGVPVEAGSVVRLVVLEDTERRWSLPCPPNQRMFIVPGMAGYPTMLAAAHFAPGKERVQVRWRRGGEAVAIVKGVEGSSPARQRLVKTDGEWYVDQIAFCPAGR